MFRRRILHALRKKQLSVPRSAAMPALHPGAHNGNLRQSCAENREIRPNLAASGTDPDGNRLALAEHPPQVDSERRQRVQKDHPGQRLVEQGQRVESRHHHQQIEAGDNRQYEGKRAILQLQLFDIDLDF